MNALTLIWSGLMVLVVGSVLAADARGPRTFDSKGVVIRYWVEGTGQPVVLIHGLFASAQVNWGMPGIIRCLASNYQVIVMDVRGHGESGKPEAEHDYGVEMAEDVARLLGHLKIKKAHVMGYSMGGMITMKLMVAHPDSVQSAVLGGMGWLREGSPQQDFWSRMPDRRKAPGTPSACIRSLGALAVTEAEVKSIHVPVAIVIGEQDPVRRLYVSPLQEVRPDWPVTVIEGAGHFNCIFKPQFREALKDWLDKQVPPASRTGGH